MWACPTSLAGLDYVRCKTAIFLCMIHTLAVQGPPAEPTPLHNLWDTRPNEQATRAALFEESDKARAPQSWLNTPCLLIQSRENTVLKACLRSDEYLPCCGNCKAMIMRALLGCTPAMHPVHPKLAGKASHASASASHQQCS